jgi:hypothetical protein
MRWEDWNEKEQARLDEQAFKVFDLQKKLSSYEEVLTKIAERTVSYRVMPDIARIVLDKFKAAALRGK